MGSNALVKVRDSVMCLCLEIKRCAEFLAANINSPEGLFGLEAPVSLSTLSILCNKINVSLTILLWRLKSSL
jgi:hypothetical protein